MTTWKVNMKKFSIILLALTAGCALPPPKEFDPDVYKGPTGRLVLEYKKKGFLVLRDEKGKKRWRVEGEDGVYVAPSGEFLLEKVSFYETDSKGRRWVACSELLKNGKKIKLRIAPGEEKKLELGPPFKVKVLVAKSGKYFYFCGPDIRGRGGEKYYFQCLSEFIPPPAYRVFTKSGKVLKEEDFKYG